MQKLTSRNNPIRIDFLPVPVVRLPGRIGMTIAPGKKIDGVYGDWDRDLQQDLRRMKVELGASVLVTLLEPHELELLRIPTLAETAQRLGFEHLELPIPDVGVPSGIERLEELVRRILHAAAAGRTIAIHCRGGLGRSGLVAACCLVALGTQADEAIAVVRATRKGAIETPAQEQFVREFAAEIRTRPLLDVREQPQSGKPPFSRVIGCLIGGAIGDALGYPIEFIGSSETIVGRFGRVPPARLDYATPGEALISDDTQMTLFVAEGVIRANQRLRDRGLCSVPEVICRALLRWYDTQTESLGQMEPRLWRTGWMRTEARLYARRAPGNTCLSSLRQLSRTEHVGAASNESKGCGAIMRSAPIGLAAGSRQRAFEVACESGRHTHGHPLGYLPAGYLASVTFDVARGMRLLDAMTLADGLLQGGELMGWTRRAREAESVEELGAGWVGEEALAISLHCALSVQDGNPDEVARALWKAVAHGGDSDSTGAITGNILGAMYGVEALPPAWVEGVELRDLIERIAGDLYAVQGEELDCEAYPPS